MAQVCSRSLWERGLASGLNVCIHTQTLTHACKVIHLYVHTFIPAGALLQITIVLTQPWVEKVQRGLRADISMNQRDRVMEGKLSRAKSFGLAPQHLGFNNRAQQWECHWGGQGMG